MIVQVLLQFSDVILIVINRCFQFGYPFSLFSVPSLSIVTSASSLLRVDSIFAIIEAILSKRFSIRESISRRPIIRSTFTVTLSAMFRASSTISLEPVLSSELFLVFLSACEIEIPVWSGEPAPILLLCD